MTPRTMARVTRLLHWNFRNLRWRRTELWWWNLGRLQWRARYSTCNAAMGHGTRGQRCFVGTMFFFTVCFVRGLSWRYSKDNKDMWHKSAFQHMVQVSKSVNFRGNCWVKTKELVLAVQKCSIRSCRYFQRRQNSVSSGHQNCWGKFTSTNTLCTLLRFQVFSTWVNHNNFTAASL